MSGVNGWSQGMENRENDQHRGYTGMERQMMDFFQTGKCSQQ